MLHVPEKCLADTRHGETGRRRSPWRERSLVRGSGSSLSHLSLFPVHDPSQGVMHKIRKKTAQQAEELA